MVNTSQHQELVHAFDYTLLSSAKRKHIQNQTGEIRARLRRTAQDIWEIGQRLTDVRSQLKHGQFDAWIKAEFGWSRRTAYNFLSVYEAFPESANFAQVDIAVSALYLMAAPSTSPKLRNQILERAQQGEKITRKLLRQAMGDQSQNKNQANRAEARSGEGIVSVASESGTDLEVSPQQIVALIPKGASAQISSADRFSSPAASSTVAPLHHSSLRTTLAPKTLQSGWHNLGEQHRLFFGDTASPQFFADLPHASLILAITSSDWAHDWVIEKTDSAIVLSEAALAELSLSQVISTFSKPGEIVVFPWLPDAEMIAIAYQLGRIVVAGDVDPQRCTQAMAQFEVTLHAKK